MKLPIFWSFNDRSWGFKERSLLPWQPSQAEIIFSLTVIKTWPGDEAGSVFYFLLWTPKHSPAFFFQETPAPLKPASSMVPPSASPHTVPTIYPFHFQSLKDCSTQFTHILHLLHSSFSVTSNTHIEDLLKTLVSLPLDFIISNRCFPYVHCVLFPWMHPESCITCHPDCHFLYFQLTFF